MHSDSVNQKNYQNILEKIFSNIEKIIQKVLEGINQIDAAKNFEQFLLWYFRLVDF